MFFKKSAAVSAGLLVGALATPLNQVVPRQIDECPAGYAITEVYIETHVVGYPIFINTFIAANTIININGGVTININNAPTQLVTTVTATSTVTVTSTVDTGGAVATSFVLAAAPVGVFKRQEAADRPFIGSGGVVQADCNTAAIFTIQNGALFSNGEQVSVDAGVASIPFAVSPIVGSITTHFSGAGNLLAWENATFLNGAASFCSLNGVIQAVFAAGGDAACVPQIISLLPASGCGNSSSVSSSTTPVTTPVTTVTTTTTPTAAASTTSTPTTAPESSTAAPSSSPSESTAAPSTSSESTVTETSTAAPSTTSTSESSAAASTTVSTSTDTETSTAAASSTTP